MIPVWLRRSVLASVLTALALHAPGVPGAESSATPVYPLKLSADGLHLVDQGNRPFFINGDAAWSLVVGLSREDADLYLENRRQKGINLVMVNLIEHRFAPNAPANHYGAQPFTRAGDFSTPNETYFQHADWVIGKAREKGIAVLLAPIYLGYACGNEGWCANVKASSLATIRSFGRFVGNRYRSFSNIVWLIGGDTDPVANGVADKVRGFVAGLREYDTVHLLSAHNAPEQSAVDPWPAEAWLRLNNVYTYQDVYPADRREAARTPFKPFFLIETYYENDSKCPAPSAPRRQAYGAVLSGAILGHVFGNCEIWAFSAGPCTGPWKPQMESEGSRAVSAMGRLFSSRRFTRLVPDTSHEVLTSGYGSGSGYAPAARASDGSTVIAYIPTRRAVTIDLAKVAGTSARAWWFDPRTAAATSIGTFPTSASQSFTPPDVNDWVLVIDNAALGFPAPGTTAGPTPPPSVIVR